MMTKQNKNLLIKVIIILIIGSIVYFSFGNSIFITSNFISNIVTFLSILFGFYITSFSIFTTSKYVSQLYKTDDEENGRKQSLMDTLIKKYKVGLTITLISILYTLIIFFIMGDKNIISIHENAYFIIFLPLVILNFLYGFEMMNILVKVIKQTAKLN